MKVKFAGAARRVERSTSSQGQTPRPQSRTEPTSRARERASSQAAMQATTPRRREINRSKDGGVEAPAASPKRGTRRGQNPATLPVSKNSKAARPQPQSPKGEPGRLGNKYSGDRSIDDRALEAYNERMMERALTVSTQATPFGCCNFFSHCSDGIMSLHYAGRLGLLDWMGFQPSDECYKVFDFITFIRPEQDGGNDTPGYIGDPCADPNGVEFGTCSLELEDFALYGREGPVRKVLQPRLYCKTDPKRALDGRPITSEREWDSRWAVDQIVNDLREDIIVGNAETPGQMDGVQQWVNRSYTCEMLNSLVVDWNGNGMNGTGGGAILINGQAANGAYNLVDVLLDGLRYITDRISWSPSLRTQQMSEGDVIIAGPTFLLRCLKDAYTCWSVCQDGAYTQVNLNSADARIFRRTLDGGMFGAGKITLDDITVHLMPHNEGLINGPTRGTLYMLTGSVGNERLWYGEHLDAEDAVSRIGDAQSGFTSMDGGRLIARVDSENLCYKQKVWWSGRIYTRAPWANLVIEDIRCATPFGPLSGQAGTSYYPMTSYQPQVANCP